MDQEEAQGGLTAETVVAMFTRADGGYAFARWGRPLAPVVFGVEDGTLGVVRAALQAVAGLARIGMAETDPEQGANLFVFFIREWVELAGVPDLDGMVPGMSGRLGDFTVRGANQFRVFRYDANGAIRACFLFLRMDAALAALPAEDLALAQAVRLVLDWGEGAFADASPLALAGDAAVLRPEVAALIRAAYDPVMPVAATDASHALRLAARAQAMLA